MDLMTARESDGRTIRDFIAILSPGIPAPVDGRGRTVDYPREYANGRVRYSLHARELYSYGSHFPLARFVPRNGRYGPLWVINGDEWRQMGPSRTGAHQSETRAAIAATGLPSLVVPFSALAGAGIDIDSIRPVHVRPDAQWRENGTADDIADVPARARWQFVARDSYPAPTYERTPYDGPTVLFNGRRYVPGPYQWEIWQHRLGDALFSAVRRGKRARYLSSFDYQETPPLYFLAQVPRGAGETVESAIDALAPRAVHAARARGRDVRRQGDVFFVETEQSRESLEQRGAIFARLTLWTRDAKPRPGEAGFVRKRTAADKRRELAYARKLWRETFRAAVDRATSGETVHARPFTEKAARKRWQKIRADHAAAVDKARTELRRVTLRGPLTGETARYGRLYGETYRAAQRRRWLENVIERRRDVDRLTAAGPGHYGGGAWHRDTRFTSRAHERDRYRILYGANARAAWERAKLEAARKYRPDEIGDTDAARKRRETVRRHVAILGTAHAATEVARLPGGIWYARGTVRHVPDLEPGRDGRGDHAPLELGEGWHLALRNTVPRQ